MNRVPVTVPSLPAAGDDLFRNYAIGNVYDEMFAKPNEPRPHYQALYRQLSGLDPETFRRYKAMTDLSMLQDGVGFTVYRQEEGIERVWPMDPVPRIIPASEWEQIERGLVQRILVLNLFLKDIYHDQHILRDRVVDPRLIYEGAFFRRQFMGATVPRDIYIHICGTDLIRDVDGRYLVLEDNGRTPSGVSYMLSSRRCSITMMCAAPMNIPPPCSTYSDTLPREAGRIRRSCCSARASTTPPISSTPSWRSGWASSWSRAGTC
jgi:uncharacterized circularly permuted ATP-grasp superfamily protein